MNLSGKSVGALAKFFKIPPAHILVVHDELDLPPGEAKLKFGGGHAGHNGLRDIHAQLGTADYWRLRLGIGHPGDKSEVAAWVLRKPPADQRDLIEACVTRTLAAWPDLLDGDEQVGEPSGRERPDHGAVVGGAVRADERVRDVDVEVVPPEVDEHLVEVATAEHGPGGGREIGRAHV